MNQKATRKISAAGIGRSLLYILLMLAVLGAAWYLVPARVQYHLMEQYSFSAPGEETRVYLAAILPKDGPYQQVRNVQVSWEGEQEIIPHPAVDVHELTGTIPAGETRTAIISYDVALRQGAARWEAPVLEFQSLPQVGIQSKAAPIVAEAERIAEGESRADAYAIFAFTASHLSYPEGTRTGGNQSALTVYNSREGGCGEFANLAVALMRAAGIPSQVVSGLALPAYPPFWSATREWGHPGGAHAWTEVHTEAGWELADPSWAARMPGILKRLWFGRNDGSHLSYGENWEYVRLYDELTTRAEQEGALIGAMSAPMHFVAAAGTEEVRVTPSVTLRKGWDGRWALTVGVYIVMLVGIRVVERKLKVV